MWPNRISPRHRKCFISLICRIGRIRRNWGKELWFLAYRAENQRTDGTYRTYEALRSGADSTDCGKRPNISPLPIQDPRAAIKTCSIGRKGPIGPLTRAAGYLAGTNSACAECGQGVKPRNRSLRLRGLA